MGGTLGKVLLKFSPDSLAGDGYFFRHFFRSLNVVQFRGGGQAERNILPKWNNPLLGQ